MINDVLKQDPTGMPNTGNRTGAIHRAEIGEDLLDELGVDQVGVAGRNQGGYDVYDVEVVLNPDGSLRDAYPYNPIDFGN
ncbi:hypothetical protein ACFVJK_46350 [Streptomyces sp. NPDC127172]|uniref:hypothetical protein n=1 Tax=Streptomyces sp. NPDC127172 TaxID=3345382 RepID=UPI00363E81F0